MYCEQKNETVIHCVCVCVFVSFFITSKSHMIWVEKTLLDIVQILCITLGLVIGLVIVVIITEFYTKSS